MQSKKYFRGEVVMKIEKYERYPKFNYSART